MRLKATAVKIAAQNRPKSFGLFTKVTKKYSTDENVPCLPSLEQFNF